MSQSAGFLATRTSRFYQTAVLNLLSVEAQYSAGELTRLCAERVHELCQLCFAHARNEAAQRRHRLPVEADALVPLLAFIEQTARALPAATDTEEGPTPALAAIAAQARLALAKGLSDMRESVIALSTRLDEFRADYVRQQTADLVEACGEAARIAAQRVEFLDKPYARRIIEVVAPEPPDAAVFFPPQVIGLLRHRPEDLALHILTDERKASDRIALAVHDVSRVLAWKSRPLSASMNAVATESGLVIVIQTEFFSPGLLYLAEHAPGPKLPAFLVQALTRPHFACWHPNRTTMRWLRRWRDPEDTEFAAHFARIGGHIAFAVQGKLAEHASSFVSFDDYPRQEALMRRGYEVAVARYLDSEDVNKDS